MNFARFGTFAVLLAASYGLLSPATARAGALNGNGAAYAGWTGSSPFSSGTLQGFVDYAVFAPGDLPYNTGYTATAGEMVYTYQVFVTGTAPLSSFSVDLQDLADNIGAFSDLGGMPPNSAIIIPFTSANWTFAGIPQSGFSFGLAFSSPKLPMNDFGSVVDTGQSSFVVPLPSPGPNDVPEPTALSLLVLGGALLGRRSRTK